MRIVSLKRDYRAAFDAYVGRFMPGPVQVKLHEPAAGLATMFAGRCGTDNVQAFRRHLHERLAAGDEALLAAMRALTADSVLACWCVDLDGEAVFAAKSVFTSTEVCHGQVLAKAWAWAKKEGLLG